MTQLIDKPFVVYIDGAKHQIGTVTSYKQEGDRLYIAATIDRDLLKSLQEDGA
jgi:hypothetical protein